MARFWIQTPPNSILANARGWTTAGPNRYSTSRDLLLVVERPTSEFIDGPIVKRARWPSETEYTLGNERSVVTTNTLSIQEAITTTISAKLSTELVSKLGASGELSPTTIKATLTAELQAKLGAELVKTLQSNLTGIETYSVETMQKIVESIKFKIPAKPKLQDVSIFFLFKKIHWDVYLYRHDYITLEHKKNWLWPDVRKTILTSEGDQDDRRPLFRITFYLPESLPSVEFEKRRAGIQNPETVLAERLDGPFPKIVDLPEITDLARLAKSAFPTRAEKLWSRAGEVSGGPGGGRAAVKYPAKKIAAKKVVAKKYAPAKKAAVKKVAAKKTPAKTVAAKRAPAKKVAAKSAPAKRMAASRAPAAGR